MARHSLLYFFFVSGTVDTKFWVIWPQGTKGVKNINRIASHNWMIP